MIKKQYNTSRGTKKWFYSMTTLRLTLPNPLKSTWKHSNGKFYPTRRIPQILRRPIITCSGRWYMVWLISSTAHMQKFLANDGQYFEWFICNHYFTIKLHFRQKNIGNLIVHLILISLYFYSFSIITLVWTRKIIINGTSASDENSLRPSHFYYLWKQKKVT